MCYISSPAGEERTSAISDKEHIAIRSTEPAPRADVRPGSGGIAGTV
jgi:hypothetical protein